MTLFSRGDNPHCHWVRFALAEKAIEVRLVEADAARPPEDLIDLNPYQTVPTLVDRELVVYDARIVCEYVDERYPHPALLPTDPAARAQSRVALQRIEQDWYSLLPGLEAADRREQQRARRLLRDSVIAPSHGSCPSSSRCSTWPWRPCSGGSSAGRSTCRNPHSRCSAMRSGYSRGPRFARV
jgi:RNA polymerase-associated protein